MGFNAPPLSSLMDGVTAIARRYTHNDHKELIHIMDIVHSFIFEIQQAGVNLPEDELKQICLGAWVYCQEMINSEIKYRFLSPAGGWFNKGSDLHKWINEYLHVSKSNVLDDKSRLIYLGKFYNFLNAHPNFYIKRQEHNIQDYLSAGHVDVLDLKAKLINIMQRLLHKVCADVDKAVTAIPTEETTHKNLLNVTNIYHDYYNLHPHEKPPTRACHDYKNPKREFLAQLAQALAVTIGSEMTPDRAVPYKDLTREQQVEIGICLFGEYSIDSEYKFLSPERSRLFNTFRHIINCTVKEMDSKDMVDCISVTKNFIQDYYHRKDMDQYGIKEFGENNHLHRIDSKIDEIQGQMDEMIKCVREQRLTCWSVARFLGSVAAVIAAPMGYGLGNVMGYFASETDYAVQPKLTLGHGLNDLAVAYVARTAGYLGFLTADRTVQYTLERAFGKMCEQLFMLAGFTAVGVGGYLVFKASVEGYNFLAGKLQDAVITAKEHHPNLAREIDLDFINCLCNLPPEIFSDDKKVRLEYSANIPQHVVAGMVPAASGDASSALLQTVDEREQPRMRH